MSATYNLDATDKRILYELEKNARIPVVQLAKLTKKSKDAVKYRITQLEKKQIITGYKTWIDCAKFGYFSQTFYLTIKSIPARRDALVQQITKNPKVYWFGVSQGAWNIGVTFFVKNNVELAAIKQKLLSEFGDIIIDIQLTSLVNVSVHEKSFLYNEHSKLITFTQTVENTQIDQTDKNILQKIYWNARLNIATIAHELELTSDIVKYRIRKLEKSKIIIRYTAVIDYHKIGYEFYKAFVYCNGHQDIKKIRKYVEGSDKIINFVEQIASWDFELIVFSKSAAEYHKAIDDFTTTFANAVVKIESANMETDIIFPCSELPI